LQIGADRTSGIKQLIRNSARHAGIARQIFAVVEQLACESECTLADIFAVGFVHTQNGLHAACQP
jgi:hypothetical protein